MAPNYNNENNHQHQSSTSAPLKLVVVGGGVMGLATGISLQEAFPHGKISIISQKWTPHTTGDVSAGLIYPYLIGAQTSQSLVRQVLADSIRAYHKMIHDPSSGKFGISMVTMYEVFPQQEPPILDVPEIIDLRQMSTKELTILFPANSDHRYKSGLVCTTYTAEPSLMLPYLMQKFQSKVLYLYYSIL